MSVSGLCHSGRPAHTDRHADSLVDQGRCWRSRLGGRSLEKWEAREHVAVIPGQTPYRLRIVYCCRVPPVPAAKTIKQNEQTSLSYDERESLAKEDREREKRSGCCIAVRVVMPTGIVWNPIEPATRCAGWRRSIISFGCELVRDIQTRALGTDPSLLLFSPGVPFRTADRFHPPPIQHDHDDDNHHWRDPSPPILSVGWLNTHHPLIHRQSSTSISIVCSLS